MSGVLILQAITVLLAIPVAVNTGREVGGVGVTAICVLALLLVLTCAVISRPWATAVIVALQVLTIAGWALSAPLGIMGIVFAAVWATVFWFRTEFRRRMAAGTLPSQQVPPPPPLA
jgi:phosphotransferase system  glucose/maltose/N-acetylglucosamine-specific IIC component